MFIQINRYSFHFFPVVIAGMVIAALCQGSSGIPATSPDTGVKGRYRIMFYNVENLFDVSDDSLTADESYTPAGDLHWTVNRYTKKLMNICKVIIAVGGWRPPDVIGLCEVENREVLEDLLRLTPLSKFPYRVIHHDSPDKRGIDVALLVNENTTRVIQHGCFRINQQGLYTRDILYVKAMLGSDTCHIFVNHWPSRSAGQLETEKNRFAAAMLLKHLTDSLFAANAATKILIMGDFNDEPVDESMAGKLNARVSHNHILPADLYNLARAPSSGAVKGTLKYQGAWNTFDQIIVSGRLLMEQNGLWADSNGYVIMQQHFLLKPDETYNGYKPYRTYNGFIYQGGFSDHLPVYVDLVSR